MSVNGALFAGVSGLKAESSTLGVISNNISNANTVGYKAGSGAFETLVTNTNGSSDFSPGGVLAQPVQHIDQQGLLQSSSSNTDVGITGRGFFVVANQLTGTGGIASTTPRDFTRAGSFTLDKSGNLVNTAGYFLLGVPTDTKGNPVTANPIVAGLQPVNVGTLTGIAKGTSNLSVGANLPAVPSAPSHLKVSGTLDGTNSFQDPAHYVLTGSTGAQYDAQIYYQQTSATTYNIQVLNCTPIGNSAPVNATKTTFPVTIGTATLTAGGATLAGGTAVQFQDGSTLQPVLDVSGLKLGTANAIDRAAVDFQDVTSSVYDSLGVAHSLMLEFSRGSDLGRAAPTNIANNGTFNVTLNNTAANTQADPKTYVLYSANGFAYQAKLSYSVPITPAATVTISATDIEPLPGSNSPPLPTGLFPMPAGGFVLGTVNGATGAVLTNPTLTLQGTDTLKLGLGATQPISTGPAVTTTIGPNTVALSETVAPAGQNQWITAIRNMTISATGAPSVVFPAGAASGFPIYLNGLPAGALGAITPPAAGIQFDVTGNINSAGVAGTITPLGQQRIVAQNGNVYTATLQFNQTAAGAGNVQITALTPVGNAPAATVGFPVNVGLLTFNATGSTFTNGASPVTVAGVGATATTLTFNNQTLAGITNNAAATTLGVNTSLGTPTAPPSNSTTTFNADGTLATGAPSTLPQLTMSTGASAFGGSTFTLNLGTPNTAGGLTQFTDQFAISFLNQDGVRFGFRTGVSFDKNGLVSAVFDNGQQIPLFKVPLVNFANQNQLQAITGNVYGQTTDSGDPVPNFPGVGGTGQLSPATLEASTVDLSTEFANLIVTQRSFSADAKTITTSDQMLQELIDVKR